MPPNQKQALLRETYEAQLKKMLAYVTVSITSFIAQFTVFYLAVVGTLSPHKYPALILPSAFWLSQCYFAVAIITKYQELKTLEWKLGISKMRNYVYYPYRPRFGKIWDWLHRKILGTEEEDYAKLASALDWGAFFVLTVVTLFYGYIVWILLFT